MKYNINIIQPVYTEYKYIAYLNLTDTDLDMVDRYDLEYEWTINPIDVVYDVVYDPKKPSCEFRVSKPNTHLYITCHVKFVNRATQLVDYISIYTIDRYFTTIFNGSNTQIDYNSESNIMTPPHNNFVVSYSILPYDPFANLFKTVLFKIIPMGYAVYSTNKFSIKLDTFEFTNQTNGIYRLYDDSGNIIKTQALYTPGELDDYIDSKFRVLKFTNDIFYIQFISKGTYQIKITSSDMGSRTTTFQTDIVIADIDKKIDTTSVLLHSNIFYSIKFDLADSDIDTNKLDYYLKFIQYPLLIYPIGYNVNPIEQLFKVYNYSIDTNNNCIYFLVYMNSRFNIKTVIETLWYLLRDISTTRAPSNKSIISVIASIYDQDLFDDLVTFLNNNYNTTYSNLDKDVVYDTIISDIRNYISNISNIESPIVNNIGKTFEVIVGT